MAEQGPDDRTAREGEWFRLLVEQVVDYAIFVVDPEGLVQTWSGGAERLLGYREDEVLGRTADRFSTFEDLEAGVPQRERREALATGRGEDDRWYVRKDGSRFWSSGALTPLRDEAGRLRGFAKIMRDRTAWRQAEQSRLGSEAHTAAVLETALDAILTIDREGRVVEYNPAAARMFGYSRAEVLGRDMAGLIVPLRLREAHRRGLAHYLATGEGPVLDRRIEIAAIRADGREFPVELAITRIPAEGPPRFTAYLRDITERQAEERRRAAQLALTKVLAEAASVGDAAPRILGSVCQNLGWDMGAFWLVERGGAVLRCHDAWRRPDVGIDGFEASSRGRTFARGVGLPGRVWARAEPAWVADVTQDDNFPRREAAEEEGVHGAFAFPVLGGSEVLGVVEFFSTAAQEPDHALMVMVGNFAAQVGQFIERKRMEESLREGEERFRGLMEQAPFSIQVLAPDGLTLRVNRAWEELWGLTLDQIGDYNMLRDPQLEAKGILPYIRRAFAGEPVAVPAIEYDPNETLPDRTRHEDPRRWVASVAYPLKDAAGGVREVVLVHHDISERRRAEEALRASEERFRHLADAMPLIVWVTRPDRSVEYVNRRWLDFTGQTPEEALGPVGWAAAVHPEDIAGIMAASVRSHATGEPFEAEYRIRDASGAYRWHLGRAVPIHDAAGRLVRRFGAATDIDDRKRIERDAHFLAAASAGLASIVDEADTLQRVARMAVPAFADWCSVDMAGDDGHPRRLAVAHADPAKVELAHDLHRRYPPDPDAPYGVPQVIRTGVPELIAEIPDALLVAGAHDPDHLRILRELGLKSFLSVPLRGRAGTLGAISFVAAESGRRYGPDDLRLAEDLASRAAVAIENARLYGALKEAERRKDDFLATLAHELRNPLAPIRNALHLLRDPDRDGGREAERAMAERNVIHLARLIDDLMDVARINRGRIELDRRVVDLGTILTQAVETARPLIDERHHHLTVSLPAGAVRLEADPTRLEQVFWNLLNNAAKYTPPGGRIDLAVEPDGGDVVVRVRDTGIGIRPEMLAHVFEMFVQAGEHRDQAQGGLGIGLSLVKTLVELHGGTIAATSDGPGLGSAFVVRLPRLAAHRPPAAPAEDRPRRPAGEPPRRRVLVVDDNVDAARSLARLLERLYGQQVRVAHDGPGALTAASEFLPEVILLDIGLPGLDGNEVARQLRARPEFRETLIVALTGWGQESDLERSRAAGFDRHLVKPADPDLIRTLLIDLGTPAAE